MQHHIIAKINKHLKRAVSRSVTAVIFKLLHRNNQTDPDFSVHAIDVSEKQREREAVLFISSTGSMSHTNLSSVFHTVQSFHQNESSWEYKLDHTNVLIQAVGSVYFVVRKKKIRI